MKYSQYVMYFFALIVCTTACTSSDPLLLEKSAAIEEKITLSINEAVEFSFQKTKNDWSGELIFYSLNSDDEKIIQKKYTSADDSSWVHFDSLIRFLDLYEIIPQNEIEGWIPDPASLPKKVYSFEIQVGSSKRSFSYQDPIRDVRNYWQAQNILMFVTYVQDELNWRLK